MPSQNPQNQSPSQNEELKTKPPELRSPNFHPQKDVLSLLALSVLLLVFHVGIFIKFWGQMEDRFFVPFMWAHQLILVVVGWVMIYNPHFARIAKPAGVAVSGMPKAKKDFGSGNQAVPIDKDAPPEVQEKTEHNNQRGKSQKINAVAVVVISVLIMMGSFADMPLSKIYYYIASLGTLFAIALILSLFRDKSKPFSVARILRDFKNEMIVPCKTILALFMVAASLLLYTFLAVWQEYPNLPEQIVIHRDMSLTPDAYGDKSTLWSIFYFPLGISLVLFFLSFFPQYGNYPVEITKTNQISVYQKMQWYEVFTVIAVSFIFSLIALAELPHFGFHVFILLDLTVIPIAVILWFYKSGKKDATN